MRIMLAIFSLALLASRCQAQEPVKLAEVLGQISANQTIEERKKLLEEHDLEPIARQQFKAGAKYVSIAGFALVCPGAEHRRVNGNEMIVAPLTGCTTGEPEEWTQLVSEYALRWNLLMRHYESEKNNKFQSSVSFAQIQSYYRIKDEVFKSLSLESKLLMQYTIEQLIAVKLENSEIEDRLLEQGIILPSK